MAASADFDLSQLSDSQQAALQQFTDVTGQEIKDAVPLLERSQWNVQIAIAKFFDGEGPDPVAEALAAQNATPRPAVRHENLQDSFLVADPPLRAARPHRTELAPRVVPLPPTTYRPPFLLSILFAPFQLGYKVVATLFRTVFYLFSYLPSSLRPHSFTRTIQKGWKNTNGRRMLMPRDAAARFKREFEEEYDEHGLPFFEGGHAQALDLAKRDLKFLLIVLMSPEHDDTECFTRGTLLSPDVVNFINDPANNIILWGGNVLDSEAYQVSLEYSCTKFPFSALVCLTPKEGSTRMGIVKRLVGPMTPAAYIAGLQSAINKYAPDLEAVRAERAAQQMARNLRTEQDSAYERSLARDRERARQRREAEAAAAAAEKKAREEAEAAALLEQKRQQWRRWRAATLAPEPNASEKDAVRLALNMPDSLGGGRVVRRFRKESTLEDLYAFIECYDLIRGSAEEYGGPQSKPQDYEHKYAFRVASVLPREVLEPSEEVTIAQKMGRGGNLIVEEEIEDEIQDDSE
ncbi:hypothetical protein VTK73DRAFT_1197 [Phialemonium thermophilum]|uniref:UAS domain-containing protein n=1 Tax=Phialemonium thermophilum TaxID=223376 RepID=A0ABR3XBK5_9PEZI